MPSNTHPLTEEDLMAYLDGELPVDKAISAAAHLEYCHECQQAIADLKSVSQYLTQWRTEPPSHRLRDRVNRELDNSTQYIPKLAEKPRSLWATLWSRPMAIGVCAASVLVLIGVFVTHQGSPVAGRMVSFRASQPTQQAQAQADHAPPAYDALAAPGDVIGGVLSAPSTPPATSRAAAKTPEQLVFNQLMPSPAAAASPNSAPMIVRHADLTLVASKFDTVRARVEQLVTRHQGYVAQLNVSSPVGAARSLSGVLRVPGASLDRFLADLKQLGHVESESQQGDDVTQQYVDTEARLANLRTTEQRLNEILRQRTGRLSDVLAVEQQVDRVRGEIDSMEATRKALSNQITYASVQLTVNEEYKASLSDGHISPLTRLRNAAVQGYRRVVDAGLGLLLFLLSSGPLLLIVAAVLFFPVRLLWRHHRAA